MDPFGYRLLLRRNIRVDIKKVLTEAVSEAVQKAIQAGTLKEGKMVPLVFTVPPQKAFGDLQQILPFRQPAIFIARPA